MDVGAQATAEKYVYIAGAFSGLPAEFEEYVRTMYARLGEVCASLALNHWLPEDPGIVAGRRVSSRQTWQNEFERVGSSVVVVAYVGLPSLAIGAELEMARVANVPVLLLFELNRQDRVPRVVLGNPAVVEAVSFSDIQDMADKLGLALADLVSNLNLDQAAADELWPHPDVVDLKRSIALARNRKIPISVEEWKTIHRDLRLTQRLF